MNGIDFHDKVAVITGASSGIGAETAIAFASYGAKLTLVGRDEAKLLRVAQQCLQKHKLVPLWLNLDLTQHGSCEVVINKTVEMYGKIDVLVNCAGKIVLSSLSDNSMAAFDEMMNVHCRIPYYLSQLALPHLIKTKGNIVNIGSAMSKRYKPGFLPYIISKTALETLAKHAAPELVPQGVRINTISPGVTRTNILHDLNSKLGLKLAYEDIAKDKPSGIIMEPKEVATLICLTASNMFPNLSGSELMLDGGACMT